MLKSISKLIYREFVILKYVKNYLGLVFCSFTISILVYCKLISIIHSWLDSRYSEQLFGGSNDINFILYKLEIIFSWLSYTIPPFTFLSLSIIFFITQFLLFKNISFRYFQIKLGKNILDQISFIMAWFSVCSVFNYIILSIFNLDDPIYKFIAVFIVQLLIYYILLRTNAYDHSIVLRRKKIST